MLRNEHMVAGVTEKTSAHHMFTLRRARARPLPCAVDAGGRKSHGKSRIGRERSSALWQPGGWKISAAARQREHLRVGDAAGCARSDGPIKKDRQMVAAVASIAAPARLPRRCLTFVSRWGIES